MPQYDMKCTRCGRRRNGLVQLPVLERGERIELEPKCRCGSVEFMRADKVHKIGATPATWSDQCGTGNGRLLAGGEKAHPQHGKKAGK